MKQFNTIYMSAGLSDFLGGAVSAENDLGVTTVKEDPNDTVAAQSREEVKITPADDTPVIPSGQSNLMDILTSIPKDADETKNEEVEEVKVEETKPVVQEVKPTVTETTTTTQTSPAIVKDYTGLDAAAVKVFKQMSNEAYAYLRPIYDEHGSLKQTKQEFENYKKATAEPVYFDPVGYVSNPTYVEKHQRVEDIKKSVPFWKEQLSSAMEGGEIVVPQRDANGQTTYIKRQSTRQDIIDIQLAIPRLESQQDILQNELKTIEAQYTAKIGGAQKVYDQALIQYFPDYADKTKADKDPIFNHMLTALAEQGQAYNPIAKLFAASVAHNTQANAQLKQQATEITRLKQLLADGGKTITPSTSITTGLPATARKSEELTGDDVTKNFDEYKRRREMGVY